MLNFNFLPKGIASRLKAVLNDGNSLLDFYYSIGSLVLIKVTITCFCRMYSPIFIFQFRIFTERVLLSFGGFCLFDFKLACSLAVFCIILINDSKTICLSDFWCRIKLLKLMYFLAMLMEYSVPLRFVSVAPITLL